MLVLGGKFGFVCYFVTFERQKYIKTLSNCLRLSLGSRRIALTIFIFVARAFISAGFQVAFVYTPEAGQQTILPL